MTLGVCAITLGVILFVLGVTFCIGYRFDGPPIASRLYLTNSEKRKRRKPPRSATDGALGRLQSNSTSILNYFEGYLVISSGNFLLMLKLSNCTRHFIFRRKFNSCQQNLSYQTVTRILLQNILFI